MIKKLYFQNSKGRKLCGILSNQTEDRNKLIVILVHGFTSNKNSKSWTKLVEVLDKNNISSFRFDIYGHGESKGKIEDLTITEAIDNVIQAINFLKNNRYLKIGLVGSSFGGCASIIAASKTKDLLFLGLKSPVSSYEERAKKLLTKKEIKEWKKKGYRILGNYGVPIKMKYSYYEDFKNNDGYKVASKITIPTLIVHGNTDESVPIKQSIKLSKLIPSCQLKIVVGANHRYTNPTHFEKMINLISKFIINYRI